MAWYDEARFYHIYPLGLLDAPKENSYDSVTHRFSDLDNWITHIKETGFNAIYIGPLFESVGHGYETTDYKKLDSRLGDNDDLKKFVKKCHDNDIKVIFDGVFNHTGRDFFAFKDIKENRENSRYKDWYCNVNFWGNNEYNDGFSYDNWGGYNLLAKLNQRNPEVRDYICDVIRFWVSEFDVDGIRLDAADVLDFEYMKALRGVANEVKPDFWLMGEVIHGDYTRWVNEGTLHSVTNYTLHKALYSGHNDHNYFEIAHTVTRLYEMGGNRPDGLKLYNFVDNHDVERIYTKLTNKAHFTPVHILLYTLPGVPSVYYGSEFGIEGRKEKSSDASLRPALKYADYKDALDTNNYTKLIERLNTIRKENKVLSYGNFKQLMLTNRQYMFSRFIDGVTAIIAVNNDDNQSTLNAGGVADGEYIGAISGQKYTVSNGNVSITLPANSGDILVMSNKSYEPIKETVEKPIETKPESPAVAPTESPAAEPVKDTIEASSTLESLLKETLDKTVQETINDIKPETVETKPVVPEPETTVPEKATEPAPTVATASTPKSNAAAKYNIPDKYSKYDPDVIKNRTDYDNMCIEELQVAILEKMSGNGYIDAPMIKTVMDNVYLDSLKNWVKSFR